MTINEILEKYSGDTSAEYTKLGIFPFDILKMFVPGSFIQFAGETNTGKTIIALHIALKFCQQGKKVLYIDADNAITSERLESVSLSQYTQSSFFLLKLNTFTEVEEAIDAFIEDNTSLIIVDSLPCLINENYLKISGKKKISINNNNSNYDSRPLGLFFKKYKVLAAKNKTSFVFINNFRTNIVMPIGTVLKRYGPKCVDYSCSTIIELCNIPKKHKFGDFQKGFPAFSGKLLGMKVVKNIHGASEIILPISLSYANGILDIVYAIYFYKKQHLVNDLELKEFTKAAFENQELFDKMAKFYLSEGGDV